MARGRRHFLRRCKDSTRQFGNIPVELERVPEATITDSGIAIFIMCTIAISFGSVKLQSDKIGAAFTVIA